MASVPSQSVRVQGSRFAEALTKEELSIICFIYKVPEGERERRGSAIEVFRYLEERGCINYSQPEQLVKLMRLVQREKWARETEEMITRDSSLHTHSPIHYPVEEESIAPDQTDVVLRPRSQVSQIRNKRRRAIRSCSPSREREERDGPLRQDGRACSNSCDSCKAFFRAIKSPETTEHIAEAVHKTIIEQLSKLSLEDECHSQEDEEELTEQDQDAGGEEKVGSRFSRKGSTISHKSTRSSGYGSMLFENPPSIVFGTVEEEQPDASSSSSDTISPTTTIRPEFDSLLGSFLTPPPPLSRQSSNDEYFTATSEDESREDTALASSTCSSTTQPLTNQNVDHALPLQAHAGQNIVHSPPPRGREVLIGSMELKMEEVMKDIEDRDINKVYTSYPFPFVSQSQHFQLHFYPNNKECTHCVLHLMMLRPSSPLSPSHPSLSRLSAQVCVYEGGIKDVPAEALPNSPLRTSTKMMDHMATPTQDDAQYMAVFPNLLSHRELAEVRHNTLVIKAVLEHTIASS